MLRRYATELLICLFLIASTTAAFWQTCQNDFVHYDDDDYVVNNERVHAGLSADGFRWAFTTTHAANWHPLTWISLQLDYEIHGLDSAGFHRTNLLFHIASTLLLLAVLRLMTGATWPSAFVAALFALHPLHVESVAWVAERKDVLSTFFWMLTLLAYYYYVKRQSVLLYLLVVATFALGLLSKPMLVTLPFVMLLLDWWPLGRTDGVGKLLLEKTPLLLLSGISSVATLWAQQRGAAVRSLEQFPLMDRVGNALAAYVHYIAKMFWPTNLAVFYPHPHDSLSPFQIVGAGILLVSITVAAFLLRKRMPFVLVGWLWFFGTLVPVIGLVQVGAQAMADRYTYVTLTGLFIALAWGAPALLANWPYRRVILTSAASAALLACAGLTWLQVRYWRDDATLWLHACHSTSNNHMAQVGLGAVFLEKGDTSRAIQHFVEALHIKMSSPSAHLNLGIALSRQGRIDQALPHYQAAVKFQPGWAPAHYHLGVALASKGRIHDALAQYAEAIRLDATYAPALGRLADALLEDRRFADAAQSYTLAVQLLPHQDQLRYNYARALQHLGRTDEAQVQYREARRLNPCGTHGELK